MSLFLITFRRGDSSAINRTNVEAKSEAEAIQLFTDWADEKFSDFGYDLIRATEVKA